VEGLSVLDMIQTGWIATYPLLLFSVVTLSIILERAWSLRNLVSKSLRLAGEICPALERGDFSTALQTSQGKAATPAGRIFSDVVARHQSDSMEYLSDLTEDKRFEELEALKGPLWVLGTVSSSAPFIGLFGTVIGIVKAFHNMAIMGSGGFSVVAAGISEALIATAGGLLVGVLSIFAYNAFMVRIANLSALWREWTDELLIRLATARPREGSISRVAQSR